MGEEDSSASSVKLRDCLKRRNQGQGSWLKSNIYNASRLYQAMSRIRLSLIAQRRAQVGSQDSTFVRIALVSLMPIRLPHVVYLTCWLVGPPSWLLMPRCLSFVGSWLVWFLSFPYVARAGPRSYHLVLRSRDWFFLLGAVSIFSRRVLALDALLCVA